MEDALQDTYDAFLLLKGLSKEIMTMFDRESIAVDDLGRYIILRNATRDSASKLLTAYIFIEGREQEIEEQEAENLRQEIQLATEECRKRDPLYIDDDPPWK